MNTSVYDPQAKLIRQVYEGDQDYESVHNQAIQTVALINDLRANKEPVLIITDIHALGNMNEGATKAAYEALMTAHFDKLAIVGTHTSFLFFLQTIIKTFSQQHISLFENEPEAIQWLQSPDKK